jgi:hypothetical protein
MITTRPDEGIPTMLETSAPACEIKAQERIRRRARDPFPHGAPTEWDNARAARMSKIANRAATISTKPHCVDPTTCEIDYSDDELEFLKAMMKYIATTGRKFPVWSEVLAVVRSIGYSKGETETIASDETVTAVPTGGRRRWSKHNR